MFVCRWRRQQTSSFLQFNSETKVQLWGCRRPPHPAGNPLFWRWRFCFVTGSSGSADVSWPQARYSRWSRALTRGGRRCVARGGNQTCTTESAALNRPVQQRDNSGSVFWTISEKNAFQHNSLFVFMNNVCIILRSTVEAASWYGLVSCTGTARHEIIMRKEPSCGNMQHLKTTGS